MQENSQSDAKNYTTQRWTPARWVLLLLCAVCAFLVFLSAWYWFFSFSVIGMVVSAVLTLGFLGVWYVVSGVHWRERDLALPTNAAKQKTQSSLDRGIAFIFVFIISLLLYILLQRRTGGTLISPWTLVGPKFFLLFFLAHAGAFYFLLKKPASKIIWIMLLAEYALFLLVAFIVFVHGYGFDHHIHEAAERWIEAHGVITPKQPYYIAQYMLVLALRKLLSVPLFFTDMAIVPLLSAIAIPLVGLFAFRKEKWCGIALAALPILTLPFFIHTTPNNFAMLVALITILFSVRWYQTPADRPVLDVLLVLLSLLTIAIHAFIGLPMLFFVVFLLLLEEFPLQKKKLFITFGLVLAFLVPIAYILNAYRLGVSHIFRPISDWWSTLVLFFGRPHFEWIDAAPWHWQLLYYARDILKILVVIGLVVFTSIMIKKKKELLPTLFLVTFAALSISSLLLAIPIGHPDLVGYEQVVYATRLKQLSVLFLFPLFLNVLFWLFEKLRSHISLVVVSLCLAALLTGAWYFTYPTRDPVSRFTGYPVRNADLMAAAFIDARADREQYIVIANQSVGAAALKLFGFSNYYRTEKGEQYFYSIPTGGILYPYFSKMVYEEPKRQWMLEAMDLMDVNRAYFVHTSYWAPAAQIRDAAKREAGDWWEFGQAEVWVYEYVR